MIQCSVWRGSCVGGEEGANLSVWHSQMRLLCGGNARLLWVECDHAIYHLCARSNGRQEIFHDAHPQSRLFSCHDPALRRNRYPIGLSSDYRSFCQKPQRTLIACRCCNRRPKSETANPNSGTTPPDSCYAIRDSILLY